MVSWYDMELPEGWYVDRTESTSGQRNASGELLRFVGVGRDFGKHPTLVSGVVCLLYNSAKIIAVGETKRQGHELQFPTLQDAKNYIIMRCALNNWGEEE